MSQSGGYPLSVPGRDGREYVRPWPGEQSCQGRAAGEGGSGGRADRHRLYLRVATPRINWLRPLCVFIDNGYLGKIKRSYMVGVTQLYRMVTALNAALVG